jgi:hypothetical protein
MKAKAAIEMNWEKVKWQKIQDTLEASTNKKYSLEAIKARARELESSGFDAGCLVEAGGPSPTDPAEARAAAPKTPQGTSRRGKAPSTPRTPRTSNIPKSTSVTPRKRKAASDWDTDDDEIGVGSR